MKILIIDTDRDLVEMLTNWLKGCGYEVYRAYTGERAKTEWAEHEPTWSCSIWQIRNRRAGYSTLSM